MRTLTRTAVLTALSNGPLFDRRLILESRYAGYEEWARGLEDQQWEEMQEMDDPNPASQEAADADAPDHCEVA